MRTSRRSTSGALASVVVVAAAFVTAMFSGAVERQAIDTPAPPVIPAPPTPRTPPAPEGTIILANAYPTETFDTGSLIIPMDECHQYSGQTANAAMRAAPNCYCPDSTSDNGQIRAYGLIYRLLENGIPVKILIDDAKTSIDGVDFSVTGPEPVKRYNRTTGGTTSFYTTCGPAGAQKEIAYRGAPFVIPASYATQALALIRNGSAGTGTPTRGVFAAADFSTVDLHVAQVPFHGKVARAYNQPPRPLALLDLPDLSGSTYTAVLVNYLVAAGLNTAGAGGTACAPGTIYGKFSTATDFTSDCLTTGNYATLWAPHWVADTSSTTINNVIKKVGAFVDAGNALFLECASIETVEGAFNPPSASTSSFTLSTARYRSSTRTFTVSGAGIPGSTVIVKNANTCTAYATTTVTAGGTWSVVTSPVANTATIPCRVTADSDHVVHTLAVSSAPANCANPGTGSCPSTTSAAGAPSCGGLSVDAVNDGHFMLSNGTVKNYLSNSYGASTGEGFIYRSVTSPFTQKGDTAFNGISGHIRNFRPAAPPACTVTTDTRNGIHGDSVYKDGVSELLSSCYGADWDASTLTCRRAQTDDPSAFTEDQSDWDFFTYRRKDNDPNKGVMLYLAGHDYNGSVAGTRMVLNTLMNLQAEVHNAPPREMVRSSPVVADIAAANGAVTNTYVQGTFTVTDPPEQRTTFVDATHTAEFQFPYSMGHLFAIDTTRLALDTPTRFSDLSPSDVLWDAASRLPAATAAGCAQPFDGSCRTLFTTTTATGHPTRVPFDTAHRATIEPLLGGVTGADASALISTVLAGRPAAGGAIGDPKVPTLGGIDWSQMAVIEPSPRVGTVRPTMIYAGGLDGMLHAFCANAVSPCDTAGRELWAYIPRTQLPRLRYNTQRIDGSVKVADLMGDFDGDGTRELRTILVFQTGSGDPAANGQTPSIIALDITDPGDPKVVWERTTPTTRSADEQGEGLGLAMGPVRIGSTVRGAVFYSTNNGGTGAPGMYVQALSVDDGTPLWTAPFVRTYPAPRTTGNPSVPGSAIPGGIAAVDLNHTGALTHLVVPTLYGEVYLIDASTGTNARNDALFRFTQDLQPIGSAPTIYQDTDGSLVAVVVSGGYVDPDGASWTDVAGTHYIVAIRLQSTGGSPITEAGSTNPDRPFVISFTGEVGFASATVAGGELFVATSAQDVNDTSGTGGGTLHRIDLATGTQTSTTVLTAATAASVEATAAGTVYAAGLESVVKLAPPGFSGGGTMVEVSQSSGITTRLWIQTQ